VTKSRPARICAASAHLGPRKVKIREAVENAGYYEPSI
jgi:hypothetical protein